MKKSLTEELNRMHSMMYGKQIDESEFIDKFLKNIGFRKEDDPIKADFVEDDLEEFYDTLESAAEKGGLTQQPTGGIDYQKEVESMQIGLILLGYDLPRFGVDGLFGPETAAAVKEFTKEKLGDEETLNEATLSSPIGPTSVGSPYGPRWGKIHHGVDLDAKSGTPIKSPLDGKVIDAAIRQDPCGGTIFIQHADGYKTRYCHCKQINVSKGDIVTKGDVIGLTGGGEGEVGQGLSTGPHLHFEVYKDGGTVDPMLHLGSEVGDFVASSSSASNKEIVMTKASEEMLLKLIELLKAKNINSEDLKKLTDPLVGNIDISISGNWLEMTKQLIRKFEGFSETASDDEGTFRGGYGTSKKLVGDELVDVTPETTWTKDEAEETLDYQIKNTFAPIIASQLGTNNWEKLNDFQKASILSFAYNAGPYFLTAREYGKNIKNAIENGDMEAAAAYISQGPTTGAKTGQYYPGLSKRREFEAKLFLN
jgi:GH24 family phage-related lysozyme (muramidase)